MILEIHPGELYEASRWLLQVILEIHPGELYEVSRWLGSITYGSMFMHQNMEKLFETNRLLG